MLLKVLTFIFTFPYIKAGIFVSSNLSYLYLSYVVSPIHTLSRVIHLHLFVKLYEDTESKFSHFSN